MLTLLGKIKKVPAPCSSSVLTGGLTARGFGPNERQKERKYNQSHNKYHIKDFTKHQDFQAALADKHRAFKASQPAVRLSEIAEAEEVPRTRRPYLDTSPKTNPSFGSFANKMLRKQATVGVESAYRDESDRLGAKFYYLDHTAEVLENYRKI